MAIPKHQRQWDIYAANLGGGQEVLALVLSSNESNRILGTQVLACELVPEALQPLAETPITIPVLPEHTGLREGGAISVATVASLPRNCLVSLEGRLEPVLKRVAVLRGLEILVGTASWP